MKVQKKKKKAASSKKSEKDNPSLEMLYKQMDRIKKDHETLLGTLILSGVLMPADPYDKEFKLEEWQYNNTRIH